MSGFQSKMEKNVLSLPWFHTSPCEWLFMAVVILFQPISEAKPKAVVSLRSYFPALGTSYMLFFFVFRDWFDGT